MYRLVFIIAWALPFILNAQHNTDSFQYDIRTQKTKYLLHLWSEEDLRFNHTNKPQYKSNSANWREIGCEGRGRINQILVHPENDAIIYAITPGGGVWRSTDTGASWTSSFQNFPSISTNWMSFHPTLSGLCFVATGDWRFGVKGDGLYFSRNSGQTWSKRGSPESIPVNLTKFVIHPNLSHKMVSISSQGIHLSADTGSTWTTVKSGTFIDLVLLPSNPNILVAAPTQGNQLLRSTDFGLTWKEILPSDSITSALNWRLSVSPACPNSVFAFNSDEQLFKSIDGGNSFVLLGKVDVNPSFWNMVIYAHPLDSQLIFAGGVAFGYYHTQKGYTGLLNLNGNFNGVDYHSYCLTSGGDFYLTNDNGIHKSTDGGYTWRKLPHSFNNQEVYAFSPSMVSKSCIMGTQDGGSKWMRDSCLNAGPNDGGRPILFPKTDLLAFSTDQTKRIYRIENFKTQFMNPLNNLPGNFPYIFSVHPDSMNTLITVAPSDIRISRDTAKSWNVLKSGLGTAIGLSYHPLYPNRIFAAYSGQIDISDDGGKTWKLFSKTPDYAITLRKMALHPEDSQSLWLIGRHQTTQAYLILKTGDGGKSWEELDQVPEHEIYTDLAVHPSGTLYASTLNRVYRYQAESNTWQDFSHGLSSARITQLTLDIQHERLIVSTFGRGIWDTGLTSETANTNEKSIAAPVKIFPNPAHTEINIEGINVESRYSIYDLQGRIIQDGLTEGKIRLSGIKSGHYYLKVNTIPAIMPLQLLIY